jgi:cysteinyl-tRNA synthetase
MALTLFNTLGRELQEFKPILPGKVGFYGCGPTVYNFAHIGNLRAYVFHDTLVRSLRFLGYDVTYVMNVTDVGHLTDDADSGEDKMVKSAQERGKSVYEIAQFYTEAFLKDTASLNIGRPTIICKATEHIQEMVALIQRIEANGYTYMAGGNLYFDVSKFPKYGELALLKLDELKAGARVGVDENKRNPQDFVLWFTKSKFEGQAMVWDSPWGRGYPGWHIECSAMSMKYLGEQFDIHAGGIDHVPVHHTNEIAQTEAATGKKWVNYWLHNEYLIMGGAKMSKSSGGFITLQKLIDQGFEPLDYRFFLLGGHYRSQLSFTTDGMNSAKASRKSLLDRIRSLQAKESQAGLQAKASQAGEIQSVKGKQYLANFTAFIENDLNTPRALAELWGAVKDPDLQAEEALALAYRMDEVLGLSLKDTPAAPKAAEVSETERAEIEGLIAERAAAKKAKDYARADAIRQDLKNRGIILEDLPSGTSWKRG